MAFPTLSYNPLIEGYVQGSSVDPVIRSAKDAGYVKTWAKFTRVPMIFKLSYPPTMSWADQVSLRAWEVATKFGAGQDTWTSPLSGSYSVRLAGPIQYKLGATDSMWQFDVYLEEI